MTIALSVSFWALFGAWILISYKNFDVTSTMIVIGMGLFLCGGTAWESIRAYREWKKMKK